MINKSYENRELTQLKVNRESRLIPFRKRPAEPDVRLHIEKYIIQLNRSDPTDPTEQSRDDNALSKKKNKESSESLLACTMTQT